MDTSSNENLEIFWRDWYECKGSWAEIYVGPKKCYSLYGENEGRINVGYKDFSGKYESHRDFFGFQTVEEAVNAKVFDDNRSLADIICEANIEDLRIFS